MCIHDTPGKLKYMENTNETTDLIVPVAEENTPDTAADVRHLARVVTIDEILPAENADRLAIAVIGGWNVVVGKDDYTAGDRVVFAEIDSLLPVEDERYSLPEWLVGQAKPDVEGVLRYRVKTARLRGNISQGILFPLEPFGLTDAADDEDVTEVMDIDKYEPVVPVAQNIVTTFPLQYAQKSDSERIQNLTKRYDQILEHGWFATEKIDGTAITIANDDGRPMVGSRNWEITSEGHDIWRIIDQDMFLSTTTPGMAVQGELFGEGIQSNPLKIKGRDFRVFNVYDNGKVLPRDQWPVWALEREVPRLDITLPATPAELIDLVDGMKSTINPKVLAEGVVFHEVNGECLRGLGRPNFKIISNKFLLKHDG